MTEIMGSGAALFDYDRDGDLDVYLVQSAGEQGNRLFRNELVPSGKLRFTDVTTQSAAGLKAYGMGVAAGDYDNDGFPDLYVTNFGHNVLLHNNGNGTFTDVTAQAGVDDDRWSTSAAFVDYDRDGRLDLFVLNYLDFTLQGNKRCFAPTGEPDYCTPSMYKPVTARLFHNEGGGRFKDVTVAAGIAAARGPGLGIACADFNADGWPDCYVANDGMANLLWLNQGNGAFREAALERGAAYAEDGAARAGMGVTAGDFDNDGDDDILVTNLRREGATLYRNDGKGNFFDASLQFGLGPLTFPFTGFGVEWFDYDHDTWLDLFIANGAVTRLESQRGQPHPFRERNLLLRNEGEGKRFRDLSAEAGPALAPEEVSRSVAFGDIDNDGDLDVLVTNNNGPVRLLLNEATHGRPWLELELEGVKCNRMALGARVALHRTGQRPLWRRVHTDSSYLCANDPRVHFGLPDAAGLERVVVRWPDGSREAWPVARPNTLLRLRQGTGRAE